MRRKSYKLQCIEAVAIIVILTMVALCYNFNRGQQSINIQMDGYTDTIRCYIDNEIDFLSKVTSAFLVLDFNDGNDSISNYEKTLNFWTRNIVGLKAGYFILPSGKVYSSENGSIKSKEQDWKKLPCYFLVAEKDDIYISTDSENHLLRISKSVYDNNKDFSGVVCFEYDFSDIIRLVKEIKIRLGALDIEIKDRYGNEIINTSAKEVDKESRIEKIKKYISNESIKGTSNVDYINKKVLKIEDSKEKSTKETDFRVSKATKKTGISVDAVISNVYKADRFNKRPLLIIIVMSLLLTFATMKIMVGKRVQDIGRFLIFLFGIHIIIFSIYSYMEVTSIYREYDTYVNIEKEIAEKIIERIELNNASTIGMLSQFIDLNSNRQDMNDYIWNLKNTFGQIDSVYIINNGEIIYSYPDINIIPADMDIINEYVKTSSNKILDYPIIGENKHMYFYPLKDGSKVVMEINEESLGDIFSSQTIDVKSRLIDSPLVKQFVYSKIDKAFVGIVGLRHNIKVNQTEEEANRNITEIMEIKLDSAMKDMTIFYISVVLLMFFVIVYQLLIVSRNRNKIKNFKENTKGEKRVIDRLIKKVENDLVAVSKKLGFEYEEEEENNENEIVFDSIYEEDVEEVMEKNKEVDSASDEEEDYE